MPNIYGLFFSLSGGAHSAQILTIIASVLLIPWTAFQRPSLPLALLVGPLVSYHFFRYDLTLLLLPLSLLANRLLVEFDNDSPLESSSSTHTSPRWSRLACLLAFAILFLDPIERFLVESSYLLAIPIAIIVFIETGWCPISPSLTTQTTDIRVSPGTAVRS
jgi:hypothetical protein